MERELGPRIRRMAASIEHRGPDAQRALLLDGIALGHARLSIVDLSLGTQPMRDPETGLTVVFNGEIFNYVELREALAGEYDFRTHSDTEVLLAAFRARGPACLADLNGQFAFAIWDPRDRTLWLARDRVGICPLYYARTPDGIAFASEPRALFAGGCVSPRLDLRALKQSIQLWSPVAPRTTYQDVFCLPPASFARFKDGELTTGRYWELDLGRPAEIHDAGAAIEAVRETLWDAVRLRLRADVPVAAYLSGGLDSSVVCAMAQAQLGGTLQTYSIGFDDPRYDERPFQEEVSRSLHTKHSAFVMSDVGIGELLPETVRHAEQVLVRIAPAPFLHLSRAVSDSGTRVVLTGEGSDEIFLGYDLYREARVRQFWARQPRSTARPALLQRLYPYLPIAKQGVSWLREVFGIGLDDPGHPGFSHLIRWWSSARTWRFFSAATAEATRDEDPATSLLATLPAEFRGWRPLARAQALEMSTLLAGNLLAAQGDRMLLGNGVEGRFPFLDHRLIELAARIDEGIKLRGLREKWVLKKCAERILPPSVLNRPKMPYRAPAAAALTGTRAPLWARTLLSAEGIAAAGIFDPRKVGRLVEKLAASPYGSSEADNMALTVIASTQLLAAYVRDAAGITDRDAEKVTLAAA